MNAAGIPELSGLRARLEELKASGLKLGEALAVLEIELQDRREEGALDSSNSHTACCSFPMHSCSGEAPLLLNNADFFIAHICICPKLHLGQDCCARVFQHLNECYPCFEEFCNVMREYCRKSQELKSKVGS